MAEEEQGQEKTELPTEKRLNDARDKGQVPRSREFTTVIVLIASAVALLFIGNNMAESVAQSMQYAFNLTKKDYLIQQQ